MGPSRLALWTAMSGLALLDFVLCRAVGLSFTNWLPFLAATGGIAIVGLIYGLSGRSGRIAGMANGVLLWMVGSLLGAILTYAAASHDGPLWDADMAAADAAIGFQWITWHHFVSENPVLKLPLMLAYVSLLPQILLSVFWFSLRGEEHRNAELLTNFLVALLITAAVSHLLPALGPCAAIPACQEAYANELIGLRSRSLPPIDVMHLNGLVVFPSFHTVLALLFTYAHRGSALFIPVALLNGLMLLSIPSEGGHYLIDVFAGIAVTGVSIIATNALARRLSLPQFAARWRPRPLRPEAISRASWRS